MPNYTKLFNSIVTSTIWTEDDKTRILWITMLAISDQHGEVHASIPGLARIAGISVESAEIAIEKFMSPDPYSRTPDFDGRRIAKIEGGWELLNHAKYRKMASKEDSKAATANRVRRHRDRAKDVTPCNASVTPCNGLLTQERDIADTDTDSNIVLPKGKNNSTLIESIYQAYPKKVGKDAALKAIAKALRQKPYEELLPIVQAYAKAREGEDPQYTCNPATWFNQGRWQDDPETWKTKPRAVGSFGVSSTQPRPHGNPNQLQEDSLEKLKAIHKTY